MSQFKAGSAKVLSATPNKVVLTGAVTTGNIAVGNLWKFQGESPAWFTVASIVDSVSFTLSANYSGAKALDTFFDYVVTKDFTPNLSFPELAAGDVDIRDVYTRAMRDVDALIAGHKRVTGYTEVIQADVDGNIALGVRGKSLTQTADIFTVERSDAVKLLRVLPGGGFVVSQVGPHAIGGATVASTTLSLYGTSRALHFPGTVPEISVGSTALVFVNNAGTIERMRLTNGGILALGTTVTTGALVGETVIVHAAFHNAVNNAGTGMLPLIGSIGGGDDIQVASGLVNINFGGATTRFFPENTVHGLEMTEMTADATAPAANKARLYVRDNGGGKTQLIVRFTTGAVQVIATEP